MTGTDGKTVRYPTPRGQEIGILTELREGQNHTYTVTVYNRAAQQFILDNLDAVVELSARPKEQSEDTQMQGQPWTTAHDEILTDLFRKQVPVREIAVTLKRTETGIRARLKRLGLIEHRSDVQ